MNNYELFNFENINRPLKSDINILKPINDYKKNINYLYKGLDNAKPIEEVPDKLYRDEFMEQDIEIDISSNKFREIWNQYKDIYEDRTNIEEIKPILFKENDKVNKETVANDNYDNILESFYSKAKELDNYLLELTKERKDLKEKKELLELTQTELEQEKELLNIEKEKFEEYKNSENDKLNKEKIRFQNLVEEMKNKIETILN